MDDRVLYIPLTGLPCNHKHTIIHGIMLGSKFSHNKYYNGVQNLSLHA